MNLPITPEHILAAQKAWTDAKNATRTGRYHQFVADYLNKLAPKAPHKWQKEREACARGERVEHKFKVYQDWFQIHARDLDNACWDDPGVEFRIVPPADPYTDLKAAYAAGKVIQYLNEKAEWEDLHPAWGRPASQYRIKPWSLADHLAKHFRPLREGEKPHRDDFTEEMLTDGWRPQLLGEKQQSGDQWWNGNIWSGQIFVGSESGPRDNPRRTRRPLPSAPVAIPYTLETLPTLPFEIRGKNGESRCCVSFANRHGVYLTNQGAFTFEGLLQNYTLPSGQPCGTTP